MLFRPSRLSAPHTRRIAQLCACLVMLSGCALAPITPRPHSQAISPDQVAQTTLGSAAHAMASPYPGLSGIYELSDAAEAFAIRMQLTQAAEKSIDAQYYIWGADTTGLLLLQQLYQAAERGVRVRLLLDDNGIDDLDPLLAKLHSHPNIEVRLFNPFPFRQAKRLAYLIEFSRLNHRMHNKSFTADNAVTVVGGRNIGDAYFGDAADQALFADLDVLAVGEVVSEVSTDFDVYWHSPLAYPLDQLLSLSQQDSTLEADFAARLAKHPQRAYDYLQLSQDSTLVHQLNHQALDIEWVQVEMVSDSPIKALSKARNDELLTYQLQRAVGEPSQQLDLVSSYFVPTKTGAKDFARLAHEQQLKIRILTNSYEATDVAAVHAGYMKQRKRLVNAGIELYELKSNSSGSLNKKGHKRFGSSGSSLHAKTFAIDQDRVFIGSFNFDPRSAHLNTELGFVIHSPRLAQKISTLFDTHVLEQSYQVQLNDKNQLIWVEHKDNKVIRTFTSEPNTGFFSRWWLTIMSKLPIEWLL